MDGTAPVDDKYSRHEVGSSIQLAYAPSEFSRPTREMLAALQRDSCTKTYVRHWICNRLHPHDRLCSSDDETWVECSTMAAALVPSQSPSVRYLLKGSTRGNRVGFRRTRTHGVA